MEALIEIRDQLTSFQQETRARFDGIDTRFDGVDARLDRVEAHVERTSLGLASLARTVGTLAEETRGLGRIVGILAEEQARVARAVGEFGERLSLMLAAAAQARTEELERYMRLEDRMHRLETR